MTTIYHKSFTHVVGFSDAIVEIAVLTETQEDSVNNQTVNFQEIVSNDERQGTTNHDRQEPKTQTICLLKQ